MSDAAPGNTTLAWVLMQNKVASFIIIGGQDTFMLSRARCSAEGLGGDAGFVVDEPVANTTRSPS
ncbi:MAG: hypothetical protein ABI442_15190 [Gemmatimonadaceae bacterium]